MDTSTVLIRTQHTNVEPSNEACPPNKFEKKQGGKKRKETHQKKRKKKRKKNKTDFPTPSSRPIPFSPPPPPQASVTVVGYPIGGDTISVTKGVVSRIEVTSYAHGSSELLGIQIDAAINAGNSGGPAFSDKGECVGIAFQVGMLIRHLKGEGGWGGVEWCLCFVFNVWFWMYGLRVWCDSLFHSLSLSLHFSLLCSVAILSVSESSMIPL